MLFNPLETFKSFGYTSFFGYFVDSSNNLPLYSVNYSHNSQLFSKMFLIPENTNIYFLLSLFICLSLLYIYFNFLKSWQNFIWVFFMVIITTIIFHFITIETFAYLEIGSNNDNIIYNKLHYGYSGISSIFFVKEGLSFVSLFLLWWFLSNYSLTDTLLIPRTIYEILDEVVYRRNLELFANTLHLKTNEEAQHYQEFFIKVHGILLFILIANVQGMIPYSSTITSSLINTFYIALAVFINIWVTLIREKGWTYFFSLFLPSGCPFALILLLNPLEFISYSFRLVSLSVRLFANMMAGHILMKVIAGFSWSLILLGDFYVIVHFLPFLILFILTFLELAVAFIQTYIFVVLVYMYLADIFISH